MYYRVVCDPAESSGYLAPRNNEHETLMRGSLVDEKQLALPYEFSLELEPDEEASLIDYYDGKKLMSRRLLDCLRAAGVDNLQVFPVKITEERSGKVHGEHVKVNVIGLVSCVDNAKSKGTPLADVKVYQKLVITPELAGGLKMFRLAESRTDVIVAEQVARAVKAGGFRGIEFEAVS